MIDRHGWLNEVGDALRRSPAALLLGPRQCGKTTLARQYAATRSEPVTMFDCESPVDAGRLAHPASVLEPLSGLVVIDEAQRLPHLFPVLRVLIDRPDQATRFLLLGSASPQLVKGASESLAGRVALLEMSGFSGLEVGPERWRELWIRGGFPRSYLAESDADSLAWRQDFVQLFLERDLPALGLRLPTLMMHRFWTMLAHYHGQTWNAAEFAQSLGISQTTVRHHLDVLTQSFVVRQLPPWYENLGKRQVKAPKVYIRDTGLLHALLGLPGWAELTAHPKLGASWEGFVIEEIIRRTGGREASFWATQAGAELDLRLLHRGRKLGFEVKFQDAPSTTRSMHIALTDLQLDRLYVIYPGTVRYPLTDRIECLPLAAVDEVLTGH